MTAVRTSPDRVYATQWAAAGPSAVSGVYVADSPKVSGRRARRPSAARVTAPLSPGSSGGNRTGLRLSGSTRARYSLSVPW